MWLSDWLTVIVVGWFVIIVSGPNMLVVFRNSLIHSRQAGILTALALARGLRQVTIVIDVGRLVQIPFLRFFVPCLLYRSAIDSFRFPPTIIRKV
jgi:threonine/homoserine/homoserine lactone efflux protein